MFSPDESFIQEAKYVSSPPIALTGQGSLDIKPPATAKRVQVPPKAQYRHPAELVSIPLQY